jgi:SAM-dependent methyltransferase
MMTTEHRVDLLSVLRQNKLRLSLPIEELQELDLYLQKEWNICLRSIEDVMRLVDKKSTGMQRKLYWKLQEQQASYIQQELDIPRSIENKWYDFIAQDPINGIVHSQKRTFIFDGVAWVTALCRSLDLKGEGLDVGCHTGYQTMWLGRNTHLSMTGIDVSSEAIAFAAHKADKLANAQFMNIDYKIDEKVGSSFDLVFCSDSFPCGLSSFRKFLRWCADRLTKHGILILCGDLAAWARSDHSSQLTDYTEEASLGYGIADVVGGWNGDIFDAKAVLVLIKDDKARCPDDLLRQFTEVWDEYGFKNYANDNTVPATEKTVGYFRAKQNQA